jgi:diphthamide synthase (EF-2-diphthine--ammonia ligase)
MLAAGLEARIVCLDPARVGRELAGRQIDAALLAGLPASVDPCGERGEFHTFVTAGPMLREPVAVAPGEIVDREGFVYADLTAV